MISNFQNKTAIITGASNGIGMEIGKKFLQAGANVVFSDYAKFDLESLTSGISSKVGNAHSFYGNLQTVPEFFFFNFAEESILSPIIL